MKTDLDQRNATALIIGGGSRLSLKLATRWLKSPYPVLHDPDRSVYRAFGLERVLGIIQQSGTVVVGADGKILLSCGGANPVNALSPEAVLTALEATTPDR
jgi:peroxiredoxin